MRKRKVVRGAIMTEREVTEVEFDDNGLYATVEEARKAIAEEHAVLDEYFRTNDLHEYLRDLAQEAMAILDTAQLPNRPDQMYECRSDLTWSVIENSAGLPPPGGMQPTSLRSTVRRLGVKEFDYEDYVAWALDDIEKIRRDFARGDYEAACRRCIELGQIVTECRLVTKWNPVAKHGLDFAPKGRGTNEITKLIYRALDELGSRASARDVAHYIWSNAPTGLIDSIDSDGSIEWCDHGKERTMASTTFQNKVSRAKVSRRRK
jgi:hypothetical protein